MTDAPKDLEMFFPYRLAIAAEAFSRLLADVYRREYGLSREEWRLLFLLAEEERLTSIELARRTTLDTVQVSRASQRLQDKGFITRTVAEHDRRLRVYRATEAGRALFAEALPKVDARARAVLSCMSESEREALGRGLAALSAAVDAVRGEDATPEPSGETAGS
jgi:DNA-binding MarR family transcriptional regulator